jgi:DNA-binding XRE family transcriptional regulator
MEKRKGAASIDNTIRSRRQALGLSQQALATRCSLTRQAINAVEAGHYIPNTLVALRLARALGCHVEDLFQLLEDRPRIEAEWLAETAAEAGERVQVARVGNRLLARPLMGSLAAFTAADGLTAPDQGSVQPRGAVDRWAAVELLIDAQMLDNTVVVMVGAHLTRRYPAFRLIWVHRSSLEALRLLGRGEAHAAGTHLWDPDSGEYNLPYVRQELAGRRLVVVTLF